MYNFLINCNKVSKFVKRKYLLLLNNDTVVDTEWLSSLVKLIESHGKIDMVGSKFLYLNGILIEAWGIVLNNANEISFRNLNESDMSEYKYQNKIISNADNCYRIKSNKIKIS